MTWINAYVGLPFRDGGRGRDGLDCWGLFRLVYARECGVDLPEYGEISAADLAACCAAMSEGAATGPWREIAAPNVFDGVLLRRRGAREAGHVGLVACVDPRRIMVLHTELATGAVCVPLDHHTLKGRFIGFRRHAALDPS